MTHNLSSLPLPDSSGEGASRVEPPISGKLAAEATILHAPQHDKLAAEKLSQALNVSIDMFPKIKLNSQQSAPEVKGLTPTSPTRITDSPEGLATSVEATQKVENTPSPKMVPVVEEMRRIETVINTYRAQYPDLLPFESYIGAELDNLAFPYMQKGSMPPMETLLDEAIRSFKEKVQTFSAETKALPVKRIALNLDAGTGESKLPESPTERIQRVGANLARFGQA